MPSLDLAFCERLYFLFCADKRLPNVTKVYVFFQGYFYVLLYFVLGTHNLILPDDAKTAAIDQSSTSSSKYSSNTPIGNNRRHISALTYSLWLLLIKLHNYFSFRRAQFNPTPQVSCVIQYKKFKNDHFGRFDDAILLEAI